MGPMVNELGLQGNALLVFAMIHGFSKDGSHKFIGSFQYIADWLNVSIRSVKEIVSGLIRDGYLTKTQILNDRNRPLNVYTTNYEELLERVAAGEEVKPSSIKSRGKSIKVNGAESAPLITTIDNGAESAPLMVQNLPFNGAESAPNNYILSNIDNINNSSTAREAVPFQKEEEKIFYKILFLRNAADPAAAVERLVGCFTSQGWKSKDGKVSYDTPTKRAGLAYGWYLGNETRLPVATAKEEARTKKFYSFLETLYNIAQERGGLDPMLILDKRGKYEVSEKGDLIWHCKEPVAKWCEALPEFRQIIQRKIGAVSLFYQYIP